MTEPTSARHGHLSTLGSRRGFLRCAAGVLALPWLESWGDAAAEDEFSPNAARMLLISNNLGVLPGDFFPRGEGRDYESSRYLRELDEFRDDFTVFSGLSHPDVAGGHSTENCFLTGAPGPTRSGFRNSISLDQYAAEQLGPVTRFPTLNLGVNIDRANRSLAWTRDGALIPAEDQPSRVFDRLFAPSSETDRARRGARWRSQTSLLDTLLDDTRSAERSLSGSDRRRLDQYLNSIREVEQRIQAARDWEAVPLPEIAAERPTDVADQRWFFERFELMLRMASLALESDSTRIVTLMVDAFATEIFQLDDEHATSEGYHNLSHHGQDPRKLEQLAEADHRQMELLRGVLSHFRSIPTVNGRLLDETMVLFGSNMGDSNTHDNRNLPILLAGGGLRHAGHLRHDPERNRPLSDLFVTMLHRLGIPANRFSTSQQDFNELLG
ncbi:MAG: DUF1552 domain-containing protein [Planctomycetales bacterium]|nr:DUF1552 domain-containing protein [Planctomycetales bacterium]